MTIQNRSQIDGYRAWKGRLLFIVSFLAALGLMSSSLAQAASQANWVHSYWIKNLSAENDPNGEYNHSAPRIAVSGNFVHVVWIANKSDFSGNSKLLYRRSNDQGKTFEATLELDAGTPSNPLDFPNTWNSVVTSGANLHIFYTKANDLGWPTLIYRRSNDAGLTFKQKTLSMDRSIRGLYASAEGNRLFVGWASSAPGYELNLLCAASQDKGKTLQTTVVAHADADSKKQPYLFAAHDLVSSGNNVYLLSSVQDENWFSSQNHLYLWGSTNGGQSFTRGVKVNLKAANDGFYITRLQDANYAPKLAADGGRVNVTWLNLDNPGSFDGWMALSLRTRRSVDGGATLQPPRTLFVYPEGYQHGAVGGLETMIGQGKNLYIATVMTGSVAGTSFWRSIDAGKTWSAEQKLSNGGWWPQMAIDPLDPKRILVTNSWLYTSRTLGKGFDGGFSLRDELGSWGSPQLDVGPSGIPHYIWSTHSRGYYQDEIFYRRIAPEPPPKDDYNRAVRITKVAGEPSIPGHLQVPGGTGLNPGRAMTLEFWVKRQSDEWYTYENLVAKERSWGESSFEVGAWDQFQIYSRLVTEDTADQYYGNWLGTGTTLENGRWTHVAMTYDSAQSADNWRLYVNGQLKATATLSGKIVTDNGRLLVGNSPSQHGSHQSDVLVDELRLWKIARTQPQIRADMNHALSGQETGLIAYYDFDKTFLDITGNGNTAYPKYLERFVKGPPLD